MWKNSESNKSKREAEETNSENKFKLLSIFFSELITVIYGILFFNRSVLFSVVVWFDSGFLHLLQLCVDAFKLITSKRETKSRQQTDIIVLNYRKSGIICKRSWTKKPKNKIKLKLPLMDESNVWSTWNLMRQVQLSYESRQYKENKDNNNSKELRRFDYSEAWRLSSGIQSE